MKKTEHHRLSKKENEDLTHAVQELHGWLRWPFAKEIFAALGDRRIPGVIAAELIERANAAQDALDALDEIVHLSIRLPEQERLAQAKAKAAKTKAK